MINSTKSLMTYKKILNELKEVKESNNKKKVKEKVVFFKKNGKKVTVI